MLESLEKMLAKGVDNSLLRFGLGKAHLAAGDRDAARTAWEQGLAAARAHGDKQAEKEMTVFVKKLDKQLG